MSTELKRIAVLMPRADAHTRGIFRGITRYARPLRAWVFHTGLAEAKTVAELRRWKPQGIIATIPNYKLEKRFVSLGVPLVNCSSNLTQPGINRVVTDNHVVGQLAAEHLLACGLKHLAYCGQSQMRAGDDRARAFAEHAKMPIHQYVDRVAQQHVGQIGWQASDPNGQLGQWLKQLPKPIGILACHDPMAMVLIEIGRQMNLDIPGKVAVLGVDDDAMLCEMAYPTLSSIQMAHQQIGFEAARRLDQLMTDPTSKPTTQKVRPVGVITRQSTDAMAADDSIVATALRYIHEHADQPIRVLDVVEQVDISRRSLEMRFEAAVGTSLLHAIQKAHIDLANELLVSTQLPMEQIALACGFNSRERFSAVYRQLTGQTPGRGRNSRGDFRGGAREPGGSRL